MYYKAGLAGQWPFLRVFSAIGRRVAQQRWPMAEDPRLFCFLTLVSALVSIGHCQPRYRIELRALLFVMSFVMLFVMITSHYKGW